MWRRRWDRCCGHMVGLCISLTEGLRARRIKRRLHTRRHKIIAGPTLEDLRYHSACLSGAFSSPITISIITITIIAFFLPSLAPSSTRRLSLCLNFYLVGLFRLQTHSRSVLTCQFCVAFPATCRPLLDSQAKHCHSLDVH